MDDYLYDVALSFAGSDREPARVIAAVARANGLRVFLDEQHLAETWGKNLNEYLAEIYARTSRYCVILISNEYCEGAYTNLERQHALDRALATKREYILPVRLDDSWIAGLPTSTAYLDLRAYGASEVGGMLVRKITGRDQPPALPAFIPGPAVRAIDDSAEATRGPDGFNFANARIAAECTTWHQSTEPLVYNGRDDFRPAPDEVDSVEFCNAMGCLGDPIIDVTVLNRGADATVLTAVGVVFVRGCVSGFGGLGGGAAKPLKLHRTYDVPLPDLWCLVASSHRERGAELIQRVDLDEVAMCRLPDPILLRRNRAYRYGVRLFDYVQYCPTTVELRLWARTDLGDVRSSQIRLRYYPGGGIPAYDRYQAVRNNPQQPCWDGSQDVQSWGATQRKQRQRHHDEFAYQRWEEAGRPEGQSELFWQQSELDLLGAHPRPLSTE